MLRSVAKSVAASALLIAVGSAAACGSDSEPETSSDPNEPGAGGALGDGDAGGSSAEAGGSDGAGASAGGTAAASGGSEASGGSPADSGGAASGGAGTGGSAGDGAAGDGAAGDTAAGGAAVDPDPGTAPACMPDACSECQEANCSAEVEACFGTGFLSGDFTGDCADLGECSLDNDCCENPMGCGAVCLSTFTPACMTCVTELSDCVNAQCADVCDTVETVDGGDPTGACADLAACCDTLPIMGACGPIVGANVDGVCAQTLAGFQAAGMCD